MLEYIPASFKVIEHIRPKLSCRACETIVQAPMPSLPIERGLPGPGLLAHIAISKFCDHQPLHRQSEIYAREGVELDRALMADWMGKVVFLLTPLAEAIGRHIRAGEVFHADDTTVPVLSPGLGRTATGRLWVMVRDERPWGSPVPPAVFYRYSPDRKGIHAEALLGDCRGFLHADGYAGFDRLYRPTTPGGNGQLIEVACWSHFRRKLYDVHHATASPIALEALERIAALFAIESSVNGCVPDRRRAARAEHAAPLLDRTEDVPGHLAHQDQRQERLGQGDPLRAVAMEGAGPICRRWSPRDEQQCRRARHAHPGSRKEELPVLWIRCRRTARCLPLHHHRDRKAERPQSRGLPGRHSRAHCRSSHQQDRRPAPLVLDKVAQHQVSPLAPKPRPSAHAYFGSQLLEKGMPHDGRVELDFNPEGLECRICLPLSGTAN